MTLLIAYIVIAVGFSFLCSIAEAVILTTPMSHVVNLERNNQPAGKILRELKSDVSRPLTVILTFNTVAHTLGAAGAGAQAVALFGNVYLGVFSALLTLLILIVSEIIPKALGAHYWRYLAPPTGYCLHALIIVFYPVVALLNKLTTLITPNTGESDFQRHDIVALAALGEEEGELGRHETLMLQNVIYLREIKVKTVMTPRPVIFSVASTLTVSEFLNAFGDKAFSRIPLYNEKQQITGFVLRADILLEQTNGRGNRPLSELARPMPAIIDELSLLRAFEQLLAHNQHILLVVDEYGDTKGLVTLEDVFESLLGIDIIDEGDNIVNLQNYARRLGAIKHRRWSRQSDQTS